MIINLKTPEHTINHSDLGNGRWYYPQGCEGKDNWYVPSVTTVLNVLDKPGISDWKSKMGQWHQVISGGKAFRGTAVHHFAEVLIYGKTVNQDDIYDYLEKSNNNMWPLLWTAPSLVYSIRQYLRGFVKFWKDYTPTPIAVEYPLYKEGIPYAGRTDMILMMKDKKGVPIRCILDIKTGFASPYFVLQNTAYKNIWDALYPDEPITHIGCLFLKDDFRTERGMYNIKVEKPNLKAFEAAYDLWRWSHTSARGQAPKPRFKDPPPRSFSLYEEKDEVEKKKNK